MWREIRPAVVLVVALTLITGLIYPLAMTGIAQVLFPGAAAKAEARMFGAQAGSAE